MNSPYFKTILVSLVIISFVFSPINAQLKETNAKSSTTTSRTTSTTTSTTTSLGNSSTKTNNSTTTTTSVTSTPEVCDETDPRHLKAFVDDCSKYYYCYENILEVVPCPVGFIYDSDVSMCRRGDKKTCSSN